MNAPLIRLRGLARTRAPWLALAVVLALAATWVRAGAQGLATGLPLRTDFAGSRPKPAPPASPVQAGTVGPPLRQDFTGSRAMPAPPSISTTPAGAVGAPLRIDFAGSRTKPTAPGH